MRAGRVFQRSKVKNVFDTHSDNGLNKHFEVTVYHFSFPYLQCQDMLKWRNDGFVTVVERLCCCFTIYGKSAGRNQKRGRREEKASKPMKLYH